jgi:hypothetical protein
VIRKLQNAKQTTDIHMEEPIARMFDREAMFSTPVKIMCPELKEGR